MGGNGWLVQAPRRCRQMETLAGVCGRDIFYPRCARRAFLGVLGVLGEFHALAGALGTWPCQQIPLSMCWLPHWDPPCNARQLPENSESPKLASP